MDVNASSVPEETPALFLPHRGGFGDAYRAALQRSVADATVPYGYTILNASAGGVLIRTHGAPTVAAALLFLCGAVAGFTAAALLGGTAGADRPIGLASGAPWLGLCSGVAAASGFGVTAIIAHGIGGPIAFGVVAFCATTVYLCVCALGVALVARLGPVTPGPRVATSTVPRLPRSAYGGRRHSRRDGS